LWGRGSLLDDEKDLKAKLEEVRKLCKVPSITYSILHDGKTRLAGSVGLRDLDEKLAPNSRTLYTICSLSKTFVTACIGILVDEGKLRWDDTVRKHLPDFVPNGDLRVATEATLRDFLRHSSGLANPVTTLLGPKGTVLVAEKDFMELLNDTPTGDSHGNSHFRSEFMYSNVGIGLMALLVQKASGMRFAQFLKTRILDPLDMVDTAVSEADVTNSNNIAFAYAQLSGGDWVRIDHEWTSEQNTPVLGMVGIRSSARDLTIWAAATMDAFEHGSVDSMPSLFLHPFPYSADNEKSVPNPLRQMGAILNGYYWTRPHNDPFQNTSQYHLTWMKVEMPSSSKQYRELFSFHPLE
jgi:CubicO group peptidase (beta-lactamase class C family)